MALIHQIIDFVDDTDCSLLKVAAAEAPAELRDAQILTAEDRERLEPDQFALVMRTKEAHTLKKFPITDGPNTWLSCQYFEKTSEQLPYVAQKIAATQLRRACALHNVKASPMVEKLASVDPIGNRYDEVKSWHEDRAHAVKVKVAAVVPDGSDHFYALADRYPMANAKFVKKAATYFVDHCAEFQNIEDRSIFAGNVKARAKELSVELDKVALVQIDSYAGDTYGDHIDTQLRLRKEALDGRPQLVSAIEKLAEFKDSTEPATFAKALYLFDKKAGILGQHPMMDAFKATFTKKAAKGYRWEDTSSGLSITETELVKAAEAKHSKIKSYFGETLANELRKHAVSIFDSLPKDAQATIVQISKGDL
jgi:hypothetical protein